MTATILTIVGLVLTIGWWWLRRQTTPVHENKERHGQAEQDIAKRDGDAASVHGADDLDELDRVSRAQGDRK